LLLLKAMDDFCPPDPARSGTAFQPHRRLGYEG
jgi:hypothetical protein